MKSYFILFSCTLIVFLSAAFSSTAQNICVDKVISTTGVDAESAAFLVGTAWPNGSTLKVRFLSGNTYVHSKIKSFANEITRYANIKFSFVSSGQADIRISVVPNGSSWSYHGTQARNIANQSAATMNFGWFNNSTSDASFRRTTLHEFGHALGLLHEHSHPKATIPWNKPVVYAYYIQSQGWTKAQVDRQVFQKYSTTQSNYCAYDRSSIMHYPIPQKHTIGSYSVPLNSALSAQDKRALRQMYPSSSVVTPYWTGAGNNGKWYVGDFNGDGKDDIFRYILRKSGAEVLLSNGQQFAGLKSWTGAGYGTQGWYLGDFNGDGKTDILRYRPGVAGAEVLLSTGSGFSKPVKWTGAGNNGKWYVGDFNGDGKDDIFRYMPGKSGAQVLLSNGQQFTSLKSWTGAGYGAQGWYLGDFNGDGKTDIFRYRPGVAGAEVLLSTGSGFSKPVKWTGASNNGKWYVGDFNGDGKDDIFRYMPGKSGAQVLLSNGQQFTGLKSWTGAGYGAQGWYLGDFNGDGKTDIFRYMPKLAGANVFLSDGSSFYSPNDGCNFTAR